jgi:hypothetical protein
MFKAKRARAHTLLAGAACAAMACLSGCGEGGLGDNEMRASFREHQVQSCISGIQTSPVAASLHLDGPRLCACAMDRYMAGKTTAQLRDADRHDSALRDATRICQMEQAGAAAGALPTGQEENGFRPAN